MPAWSTLVAQEIPSLLEYPEHTRVLWEYHYRYLNLGTTGSPVRLYRYQILILQSTYPDIRVASAVACWSTTFIILGARVDLDVLTAVSLWCCNVVPMRLQNAGGKPSLPT